MAVAVGVVLLLGLGLVVGSGSDDAPSARRPLPSSTPRVVPSDAPTVTAPGSATTVPSITVPPTTPPPTTPPPTTVPRTTVPPEPAPPQPVLALADNPLMADLGLPAVTCSWPAWSRDPAAQQAFNTGVVACLDQAWAPVLAERGLPFSSPAVVGFDGTVTSPCGARSAEETSFYCGSNTTFYSSNSHYSDVEGVPASAQAVFIETAAHEYGHHVQQLSGIRGAYGQQRYDAGSDSDAGLLLSRRLELQAQCFSGMFFAATFGVLGQGAFDEAAADAYQRGDFPDGRLPDHGTPERSGAWFTQGGTLNRTDGCNTFASDPGGVE